MKLPDIEDIGAWAIQAIILASIVAMIAVQTYKFILSELAN